MEKGAFVFLGILQKRLLVGYSSSGSEEGVPGFTIPVLVKGQSGLQKAMEEAAKELCKRSEIDADKASFLHYPDCKELNREQIGFFSRYLQEARAKAKFA